MPPIFTEVQIVGMHFRGDHAKSYVNELVPGQILHLEREPENPHDYNAIKVLAGDEGARWHFGFISRDTASWLAIEMDAGTEYVYQHQAVVVAETSRKTKYPTGRAISVADLEEEEIFAFESQLDATFDETSG